MCVICNIINTLYEWETRLSWASCAIILNTGLFVKWFKKKKKIKDLLLSLCGQNVPGGF